MKPWLLVLIAVLLITSSAAAEDPDARRSSSILMDVDSNAIWFGWSHTIVGARALQLRAEVDAAQNADGNLDHNDVTHWQLPRGLEGRRVPECFRDFRFARINGEPPTEFVQVSVNVYGPYGPVADNDTAKVGAWIHLGFDADAAGPGEVALNLAAAEDLNRAYACASGFDVELVNLTSLPYVVRIDSGQNRGFRPDGIQPAEVGENHERYLTANPGECEGSARCVPNIYQHSYLYFRGDDVRTPFANEIRFTVQKAENLFLLWLALAVGAALVIGATMEAWSEPGQVRLMQLLFTSPLFTRITKPKALDHGLRNAMYGFIVHNPGKTLADLRKHFGVGHSTVLHHTAVLHKQGFVYFKREGMRCRFFERGVPTAIAPYMTPVQEEILRRVLGAPGIHQHELAQAVGLPRENVGYHVRVLSERGLVRAERRGRTVRYFPSGAPTLAPLML